MLTRNMLRGLCCLAALAVAPALFAKDPTYRYDSNWPKQLPNNWTFGGITGMFVDGDDHIWVLNRPRDIDKTDNFAMLKPPSNVSDMLQNIVLTCW